MSPSRSPHPCSAPGCSAIIRNAARCPKHQKAKHQAYDATRDPEQRRFYGSTAWKAVRASVKAREPLCHTCAAAGRRTIAVDVHHLDGNWRNNTPQNLEPICRSCHNRETQVSVSVPSGVHSRGGGVEKYSE